MRWGMVTPPTQLWPLQLQSALLPTSHPWWAGPDCTSIYGRRGHWFPHVQLMTPYYVWQSPGVPRDRPQWLQACAPTKTTLPVFCVKIQLPATISKKVHGPLG